MLKVLAETSHNSYPIKSAGRLMIKEYPVVSPQTTILEIEQTLIKNIHSYKTINYVFVADLENHLVGVASIKDIYRHHKHVAVSEIMSRNITRAHPNDSLEKVVYLALKRNLKEIPVVDDNDTLMGVVGNDTIISAAYKESRDHIMRLAGVGTGAISTTDNIFEISTFKALKHRLPWLLIGLSGGLLSAKIIESFELMLSRNLILAAFIPLIVYMSDAVGTQMEAFIIRDLSFDPKLNFAKYIFRQLLVLTGIATFTCLGLFLYSFFVYQDIRITLTLTMALFVAIVSSMFTGLVIPFLFSKLKQDPANASGPIATIMQDVLSVVIYLSIAQLLLS